MRTHRGIAWLTLLVTVSVTAAFADTPLTVGDDIYFEWRPRADKHQGAGSCGFGILANHVTRADPKVVWDVYVNEIFQDQDRIVGVSAGTFDVVGGKRKPRAAITALAFSFEGGDQSIPAQIVGSPSKDNAVRGIVDLAQADALFDGLSADKYVIVTFSYADGTSDAIRIRGFRDRDRGTPMGVFTRCLHGHPPSVTGPMFPVR